MDFNERRQKTVIIGALSLVVAVVCFGFLESTGAIENGAVKIGGAFVGFVVAAASLDRIWGKPTSLDKQAEDANLALVWEDVAKVLDLRDAPPTSQPQKAMLNDYYRIRRTAENAHLQLHYATSGLMNFGGSPTHPQLATWREAEGPHESIQGTAFPKKYELDVDLSSVPEGQVVPVVTQVEYEDAFDDPKREALETHLDYPTGDLAMLILMPGTMRCTSAVGYRKVSRGEPTPVDPPPVVMLDGSVVYWAVNRPMLGAGYQVRWDWQPR